MIAAIILVLPYYWLIQYYWLLLLVCNNCLHYLYLYTFTLLIIIAIDFFYYVFVPVYLLGLSFVVFVVIYNKAEKFAG